MSLFEKIVESLTHKTEEVTFYTLAKRYGVSYEKIDTMLHGYDLDDQNKILAEAIKRGELKPVKGGR